jgi:hypothetical protein
MANFPRTLCDIDQTPEFGVGAKVGVTAGAIVGGPVTPAEAATLLQGRSNS